MTLRLRLALAIALAALPLVAGATWLRRAIETRSFDDAMREFALATMDAGGRERCEADPTHFQIDGISPRPPGPPRRPPNSPNPPSSPNPRRESRPTDGRNDGRSDGRDGGPDRPQGPFQPDPPPTGPSFRGSRLFAYRADFVSANPNTPPLPPELLSRLRDGEDSASIAWRDGERNGRRVALKTAWTDGPCAYLLVERLMPETLGGALAFTLATTALVAGLLLAVLLSAGPLVQRIRRLTGDVTKSAASRYAEPVPESGRDEIGRLARAFNEAGTEVRGHIERLEARERTLRAFVSNTTHDVAIPLTVLQGHLTALDESRARGETADATEVRGALEESHYIACLLQNLTSVAKLEASADALERRDVDLSALLERVIARHTPIARGASIALEHSIPGEPVVVTGDVTLLEQAISNVVHNALRYNHPGGHVAAVLSISARDPASFELRVADDGPGIPADELPHVFERAFRGRDARTRAPHGAGLGLHIADDVMRRHGFTLSLARPAAGGLEVTFSGPVARSPGG